LLKYRVYVRPRYQSLGNSGTLTLYFSNGYVHGTFVADSGGSRPENVSGGYHGNTIWIDFRSFGALHIEGTVAANGDIGGLGTSLSSGKSQQYVMDAKLVP
jgi:hypothetical protein